MDKITSDVTASANPTRLTAGRPLPVSPVAAGETRESFGADVVVLGGTPPAAPAATNGSGLPAGETSPSASTRQVPSASTVAQTSAPQPPAVPVTLFQAEPGGVAGTPQASPLAVQEVAQPGVAYQARLPQEEIEALRRIDRLLTALGDDRENLDKARTCLEPVLPDLQRIVEGLAPGFDETDGNCAALHLYGTVVRRYPGLVDEAFVQHGLAALMSSKKLLEQTDEGWIHAGGPVLKALWSRDPALVDRTMEMLTTAQPSFDQKDRRWEWIVDAVRDFDWKPSPSELQWLAAPIRDMAEQAAQLAYPSEMTVWDRFDVVPALAEKLGDTLGQVQLPDASGGRRPSLDDELFPRLVGGIKKEESAFVRDAHLQRLYTHRRRGSMAADYVPFIFRDAHKVDALLGKVEAACAGTRDLSRLDLETQCEILALASLKLSPEQSQRLAQALPVRDAFVSWVEWMATPSEERQDFPPVCGAVADRFRDQVIERLVSEAADPTTPAATRLEAGRCLEVLEPTYRVAAESTAAEVGQVWIQQVARYAEMETLRGTTTKGDLASTDPVLGTTPADFAAALESVRGASTPGLDDRYPPHVSLQAHTFARQLGERGIPDEKALGYVQEFLRMGLDTRGCALVVALVDRGVDPDTALAHVMSCLSLGRDPLQVPLSSLSATAAPAPSIEQTADGVTIGGVFVPRAHRDPTPTAG